MDDLPAHNHTNSTPGPQQDSHPHHILITDASVNEEEESERRKAECRRKFRKAPPWIEAACAILLVAITGSYTFYAARQANAAKKSAQAALDASITAKNTLLEIQKGGGDTHELAVQAKNQADRTKDLADRARDQAVASKQAADAATSAASTAKEALHVSERAYLAIGSPRLDTAKKVVDVLFINGGRIPSGSVEATVHWAIISSTKIKIHTNLNDAIVKQWQRHHLSSISPGVPRHLAVPVPEIDVSKFDIGLQQIIIAGHVSYNDGFPNSPDKTIQFCIATIYEVPVKDSYWIECDPYEIIPKMEQFDGYPNNEAQE